MSGFTTHYDNLKVTRNAPPEVIKAAYRTLCQKYHPDRNTSGDAERIMQVVNRAYQVLSDPELRQEHDEWICEEELKAAEARQAQDRANWAPPPPPQQPPPTPRPSYTQAAQPPRYAEPAPRRSFGALFFWGFVLLAIVVGINFSDKSPSRPSSTYTRTPPPQTTQAPSPDTSSAAEVKPWEVVSETPIAAAPLEPVDHIAALVGKDRVPTRSGYIVGEDKLQGEGLSTVSIDNGQNQSDVLVKLVRLELGQAYPVRTFFISAGDKFVVEDVSPGQYDVRYLDRESGSIAKSTTFNLNQWDTFDGIQYDTIEMTLYQVAGGNMRTTRIPISEF